MNEGQACLRSLTFETTPSKMDQVGSTANAMVSIIHKPITKPLSDKQWDQEAILKDKSRLVTGE